ncbi:MAG: phosphate acyltransferase, partial [Alphaproteobacteria bacterium]|nr:phosphate acyltransferase [Alphaproteobacteria bacterium]
IVHVHPVTSRGWKSGVVHRRRFSRTMPQQVRIALDAMGGDHGPSVVVPGAALALAQNPDSTFILFGDQARIEPLLDAEPRLRAASRLVHTDVAVRMDDKPSQALRNGRWKSSMWLAIDAVKKGEADVAISAGNTGALMAMAKFNLKMLPGIGRPAIAAVWPTLKGRCIVLDLGASIGADAESLVDMAVMGSAMSRVLFHLDRPTVGLLNIGVEEVKGLEAVREAGRILREEPLPHMEYVGFVEGDDIGKGKADVVVTEGFAGNIALKAAEGTAHQFADYLRYAISQSIWSKIGYLLAKPAFRMLREKMDPRKSNGGVFLGLNGVVIKSHGGTDPEGFAAAIDVGYEMVRYELLGKIGATIRRHAAEADVTRAVGGAAS